MRELLQQLSMAYRNYLRLSLKVVIRDFCLHLVLLVINVPLKTVSIVQLIIIIVIVVIVAPILDLIILIALIFRCLLAAL